MGYRCWDNQTIKVIRSRQVTFHEHALYKDDLIAAPSKRKQSQKALFKELIVVDVLLLEIGEGSENSGTAKETVNTEVSSSS